nr:MAG TPA: hypothetical protein [Caudoviricetes sp.]
MCENRESSFNGDYFMIQSPWRKETALCGSC